MIARWWRWWRRRRALLAKMTECDRWEFEEARNRIR
jgi:hypothetical protein